MKQFMAPANILSLLMASTVGYATDAAEMGFMAFNLKLQTASRRDASHTGFGGPNV